MAGHSNAQLVKSATEAYTRGDIDTLANLFAEDAVWHAPGSGPSSGSFRGRDRIHAWFSGMRDAMGNHVSAVELLDAMSDDRYVMFFVRVTIVFDGEESHQVLANTWRTEEGKAVESWFLPEDIDRWAATVG
jgi:uncharacterized protein